MASYCGSDRNVSPNMLDWSERLPAAETKKRGSASEVANGIPSPPALMGSEAWSHWASDKDRLRTLHRPSRRAESNLWRPGWPAHGEQRKMCKSFEEFSEYLSRTNASCLAMLPSLSKACKSSRDRASKAILSALFEERGAPKRVANSDSMCENELNELYLVTRAGKLVTTSHFVRYSCCPSSLHLHSSISTSASTTRALPPPG